VSLGKPVAIGDRVVVVGGGITGVDCATTAIRLGSKDVKLVYRRSRGELPVYKDEIAEAENEGMQFLERTMATRILADDSGRVVGLQVAESRPTGTIDATGKRDLVTVPGTEFELEADTVIRAIGQFSDLAYLAPEWVNVVGDKETLETSHEGVFAHRGVIPGAGFVVNAIALGHEAAANIDRYLQGESLPAPPRATLSERQWSREEAMAKVAALEILSRPKVPPHVLPVNERLGTFREVWQTYTEEQAQAEASRCLDCASCCECMRCVWACGPGAVSHRQTEASREIEVGALVFATG